MGARPPRAPLFSDENIDNANGWTGNRRSEGEIDAMIAHLGQSVEEVGGKVCSALMDSFFSTSIITRLAHYIGQGNHILVLRSCSDYLPLMYLSYLRYGVQWSEM